MEGSALYGDALDFAAVNNATAIAAPSRLSNWEAQSRILMRSAKNLAGAIVPITLGIETSPLVLMSSFDADHYPLHLDAVRVLIRMMILNPILELDNLPSLPEPDVCDIAWPGVQDAATSDGTDPVSIKIAANIIAERDATNPFYRLLADGPTPEVRSLIVDGRCPAADGTPDNGHWIWEKHPGEEYGKKQHSMGWDCVFVASLYNKMRVKKSIVDELFGKFVRYVDPIDCALKRLRFCKLLKQPIRRQRRLLMTPSENSTTRKISLTRAMQSNGKPQRKSSMI
jgi:hypothetical protein